jgi:uncharacterized protein (DUF952 family)
MNVPTALYKILTPKEFNSIFDKTHPNYPIYYGSNLDNQDGFIHLSTAMQVPFTLEQFFHQEGVVHLLKVSFSGRIKKLVVFESPIDSTDLFPHLYSIEKGKLPFINLIHDVSQVIMVTRGNSSPLKRRGSILDDWDESNQVQEDVSLSSWSDALQTLGGLKY